MFVCVCVCVSLSLSPLSVCLSLPASHLCPLPTNPTPNLSVVDLGPPWQENNEQDPNAPSTNNNSPSPPLKTPVTAPDADGVSHEKLFSLMDLDNNDAVYMSELGAFIWAVVDWHISEFKAETEEEYENAGGVDEEGGLDWSTVAAITIQRQEDKTGIPATHVKLTEHAFTDADMDDDGRLNSTEFLGFTHPELCLKVRTRYGQEFINNQDNNGDGLINITEFLHTNLKIDADGYDQNSVQALEHRAEETELKREFKDEFDKNGDNQLDLEEVVALLSPLHISHFIVETYDLGLATDANGDHELSLVDVKERWGKFVNNHLLNYGLWVKTKAQENVEKMYSSMTSQLQRHVRRSGKDEL